MNGIPEDVDETAKIEAEKQMSQGSWEIFVPEGDADPLFRCDACDTPITADGLVWIQHSEDESRFNAYCRPCVMKGMRLLLQQQP